MRERKPARREDVPRGRRARARAGFPARVLAPVLCLVMLLASVHGALAEPGFPLKPVRLVVSFSSGGAADITARALAEALSRLWQQQVVVENRIGAGGNLGTEVVARAPAVDLQGFTALLRAHPAQITYATCGVATAQQFAMELYKFQTGTRALHVPYKGCAPAVVDAVGGQVDAVLASDAAALPQVRSGKLRAIAMTSRQRSPAAPDIPSFAESGIPGLAGYDATVVYGLMAPAATPAAVLRQIEQAVGGLMGQRALQQRLLQAGLDLQSGPGASFRALMAADIERFRRIIAIAGIQPE